MKTIKLSFVIVLATAALGAYAQQGSTLTALQQDVNKLMTDVKADVANSDVTQQELVNLQTAVASIVSTAHKPDPTDLSQLVTLLKAVKASGTITAAQKRQIAYDLNLTLASAGISTNQVAAMKQAVMAIYTSSNVSKAEFQQILFDVEAILADLPTRKNP